MIGYLWQLWQEIRPKQWIKNLLLFSPLIFAGQLFNLPQLLKVLLGFICLDFITSSVYLVNDIFDLEQDKHHPLKKTRPLASGKISIIQVISLSLGLVLSAVFLGFYLNRYFGFILLAYFVVNLVYSKFLKHIVILDVLLLALFFMCRVIAGAVLIEVEASYWLLICTFMLATFLGLAKRRHELIVLEGAAGEHRTVLGLYNAYFLDQMIAVVTTSTLMSYILYTVSEETLNKFGTRNLLYTFPFVLYGIFRYLYLIHRRKEGGDPAALVLADKALLLNIFLWIVTAVGIIYFR